MGDLAVNIAERAIDLANAPQLHPLHDLASLADLSEAQLRKALDAFVEKDVAKAEEVLRGDALLDALYLKIFNDLLQLMMEDSRAIRRATAVMFAAKHLERFGDHAMNLAEMVIYMVRGTDIRHPRSRVPAQAT
jgi:phosphate transport system protein